MRERATSEATQAEAELTLSDIVDPRTGIVRRSVRLPKSREEPELPIVYQATLSHFDFRKGEPSERTATGKGTSDEEAERGALVEALERYCAYQQPPGSLVLGVRSSLGAPAIAPDELVLYSERQYAQADFPYRRPDPTDELTWTEGRLLGSGSRVYVPASLVYMNFGGPDGREYFTPTTSNGLAGGPGLSSAVVAGLCELVERDAFLICWLNHLPVPRIDFPEAEGIAATIRAHYRRFGLETLAFDLTSDVRIPVVMAVTIDRSGRGPAAVVGLGCHLDGQVALDKAVMEVAQMRTGAVPRYRREPAPKLDEYVEVRTLEDHAAFAARLEHLHEFSFLLETDSRRDVTELLADSTGVAEADAELCRERLEAVGCTVAYVDLTLPDVERCGVRIVRAVATGLQPIHFGYGEERLGGRRLFVVPRLLGFTTHDTDETELNPCPHPLA